MTTAQITREKYFKLDESRFDDLRRKPMEVRKTFQVGKMWEVHQEIARLILLGYKNREIAERLNISEATVSYTRNSPVVKNKLNVMEGARDADTVDLSREIRMKAPKALKLLEKIIDGESGTIGELASPALKAKTAEAWLDRAGFAAQRNSGPNLHLHAHFTAEEIEDLKARAKSGGMTIDV